jgi:hypothetical protein
LLCLVYVTQNETKFIHLWLFFFSLALQPPWAPASAFQLYDHFTDGRILWTSDQLVARPLPKHRTTQTQNKHIHTPNIHALCGIRTHDSSFRASEDSSCLRPFGYCDRPTYGLEEHYFTEQYTNFGHLCVYKYFSK